MSALYLFPPEQEPPEDIDLLAGIYALGVMDPGDAAATRLRADADPSLQEAINRWHARLALLTDVLQPRDPPETLWAMLAADIGIAPAPPAREPPPPHATERPAPEPQPAPAPESPPAPEPIAAVEGPAPPAVQPLALPPIPPPPPAPPVLVLQQTPEPLRHPETLTIPTPPPAPAYLPPDQPPPPELPAVQSSGGLFLKLATPPEAAPAAAPAASLAPWHQRLLVWRAAALAMLVIALGLAAILVLHPRVTRSIAAIGPVSAPAPLFLAELDGSTRLTLTPLATIAVPSGRDLELWLLPQGSADRPISLGVLPASGRTVTLSAVPAEGTQLLVSMEPRGGAPGGVLTGPVLYGGTLANH